jgi:hypothetical protein
MFDHSYVKGYGVDWDKIKAFVGTDDDKDRRIDLVMCRVMEAVNHDHPVCSGHRLTDNKLFNVIPLAEEAFDDDLEGLIEKEIPVPKYLRDLEVLLSGPEIFKFAGW